MWNFYRTRHTAGNICLVLFTAFLFTIVVAPCAMVGNAEAYQSSGVTTVELSGGQYIHGGQTRTVTGTSAGYQLLVDLAGTPLSVFDSLRVDFVNASGTILSVYGNDASNATYKTYSSVYGSVYSLAYLAPSSFYVSANHTVYGKVYVGTTYLYSVILTLNPPPPTDEGTSTPPSGGGAPAATTTTTTIDTGTVTVTTTAAGATSATVAVDTQKINDLINTDKPVVIEVPVSVVATQTKVDMAATIITNAADKGKDITIKTDKVQFVIPPKALEVKVLTDLIKADANTKITLDVKEVTPASVKLADKMGIPQNANLKAIGKVLEFAVIAKSTAGETTISSFGKKLKVAIPYVDADLAGLKEDSLAAYRITDKGLVFLGGDVDKVKNLVSFETDSFSSYTLMAKIAAFADIMGHWAKNDVELMAEKGIVKGMSANSFAPDAGITRAQFATLLAKALGLAEVKPAKATFQDVKSGAWYYGSVESAAAKGLVAGYKGNFSPEGRITRQEMAVMVAKALQVGGKKVGLSAGEAAKMLDKFSDKKQIAGWAQDGAAVAVKEGIITGRTADTFVAKANATRAEGTVMIKKVLGTLGKL